MDRDRLRAANAFAAVTGGKLGKQDRFLAFARELPAMLQTNGLLATWAFLLAKKKEEHHLAAGRALIDHFRAVGLTPKEGTTDPEALLTKRWLATEGHDGLSGIELRRLTAEAILYAVWLKRAAEAVLSGAGDNGGGGSGAQAAAPEVRESRGTEGARP